MSQSSRSQVDFYVNIARRRKWWIIAPLLLSLLGAAIYLSIAPKIYRASTLVLLEPQAIPDAFVRSTVTESMEGRLRTIRQQVYSRTNLESIIEEFHLDRKASDTVLEKEIRRVMERLGIMESAEPLLHQKQAQQRILMMELVQNIGRNLQVIMRGGGGPGRDQSLAFEISFEWHEPDVVAPVTNRLASRFIEENLNLREERAVGTTDFLEKETSELRSELENREKELENFKKENMGMLPDQLASNLNILTQLREELMNLEGRLEQDKQQVMMLKSQAHLSREPAPMALPARGGEQETRGGDERQTRQMTNRELTGGSLPQLESELKRLQSQYTENHPDIITLKRRVDALRAEGSSAQPGSSIVISESVPREIVVQLAQANARIDSYQKQINDVRRQLDAYKERVEHTPQVEMELNKILRGYETVRERYDNLLSRKLDAKMSEQLEKRRKGEQFRVLDPAVKPAKPFRPDTVKVIVLACLAGLTLGGGLGYLRELMDPCFYDPGELEAFLETPVIMSLPVVDLKVRPSKSGNCTDKPQLGA